MDGTSEFYFPDDSQDMYDSGPSDTIRVPSAAPMEPLQSTQATKRTAEEAALENSSSTHRKRRRKEGTVKKIKNKPVIIVPKVPYWQVIKPSKKPRSNRKSSRISGKPEIWTSSRDDLIKAFPGLKKTTAGLSYMNFGEFPTFVWFIEGQGWPEDSWDGKTTIELSTVIEFSDDPFSTSTEKGKSKEEANGTELDLLSDLDTLTDSEDGEPSTSRLTQYHPPSFPSPAFHEGPLDDHGLYKLEDLSDDLLYPTFAGLPSEDGLRFDFLPTLPSEPWFSTESEPLDGPSAELTRREDDSTNSLDRTPDLAASLVSSPHQPVPKLEPEAGHYEAHQAVNSPRGSPQQSDLTSTAQALPTPSATSYLNVVPEITTLMDCHKNNIPVVVIASNSSSIIPFSSGKNMSVAVLGFFDIVGVEHRILENGRTHEEGVRDRVRWTAKLVYTSPEETVGGFHYNKSSPWWLPKTVTPEDSASTPQEPAALSILVESLEGVPERLWWHCRDCGILNSRSMFRHRICSHCSKKESTIPAISIQTARVKNKCSPDSFPADDTPAHMTPGEQKNWPNNMRTFFYRYNPSATTIVKHIFACNLETLQSQATDMFQRIQLELELRWQLVPGTVASGPYFSYTLKNKRNELPPCLTEAGKLMVDYAKNYGEELGTRIEEFVVLAWETAGSKKGHIFPTKDRTAFVLCLGADADFELCRDVKADPESSGKLSKQQKAAIAKKANAERLRINLVHGDMMIVKGDDFNYSLTRTGTTILIYGFLSAETDHS